MRRPKVLRNGDDVLIETTRGVKRVTLVAVDLELSVDHRVDWSITNNTPIIVPAREVDVTITAKFIGREPLQ